MGNTEHFWAWQCCEDVCVYDRSTQQQWKHQDPSERSILASEGNIRVVSIIQASDGVDQRETVGKEGGGRGDQDGEYM